MTGIGLAMVEKIVEMYGGSVWLESEPGKGSMFYFTLPKREATSENEKVQLRLPRENKHFEGIAI